MPTRKCGKEPLLELNGYTIDHQSDLAGANLSGLEIIDADLSHSNLAGANLAGSRAINVNWEGTNLERANLVKTDFTGEDLEGVDFQNADLSEADFSEANLKGANLAFTNLTGTNFKRALMSGVCLDHSNMSRTDFSGVDFHGHVEFSEDEIQKRLRIIEHLNGPGRQEKEAWRSCSRKVDWNWIQESHSIRLNYAAKDIGRTTFAGAYVNAAIFDGANFGSCKCENYVHPSKDYLDKAKCYPLIKSCEFSHSSFRSTNLQGMDINIRYSNDFTAANLQNTKVLFKTIALSSTGSRKNIFPRADLRDAYVGALLVQTWTDYDGNCFFSTDDGQFKGAKINGLEFSNDSILRSYSENEWFDQSCHPTPQDKSSAHENFKIKELTLSKRKELMNC
tara:strand:+ start:294 stop:1472 length:1179 start_codon:yes stop_codon:yes gene_type:complete